MKIVIDIPEEKYNGFYLDSGYDWVDDVVAWCELPSPYKARGDKSERG